MLGRFHEFSKLKSDANSVFGWFNMGLHGGNKQRSLLSIDLDDSCFEARDAGGNSFSAGPKGKRRVWKEWRSRRDVSGGNSFSAGCWWHRRSRRSGGPRQLSGGHLVKSCRTWALEKSLIQTLSESEPCRVRSERKRVKVSSQTRRSRVPYTFRNNSFSQWSSVLPVGLGYRD